MIKNGMCYLQIFKLTLTFLFLTSLALANDSEIIKNLEFYMNYDSFSSDDYDDVIDLESEDLEQKTQESSNE